MWKTRKLKDPIIDKVNVIYNRTCTCKQLQIEETKHNAEVKWNNRCSFKKTSEVGDHLLVNPGHNITVILG